MFKLIATIFFALVPTIYTTKPPYEDHDIVSHENPHMVDTESVYNVGQDLDEEVAPFLVLKLAIIGLDTVEPDPQEEARQWAYEQKLQKEEAIQKENWFNAIISGNLTTILSMPFPIKEWLYVKDDRFSSSYIGCDAVQIAILKNNTRTIEFLEKQGVDPCNPYINTKCLSSHATLDTFKYFIHKCSFASDQQDLDLSFREKLKELKIKNRESSLIPFLLELGNNLIWRDVHAQDLAVQNEWSKISSLRYKDGILLPDIFREYDKMLLNQRILDYPEGKTTRKAIRRQLNSIFHDYMLDRISSTFHYPPSRYNFFHGIILLDDGFSILRYYIEYPMLYSIGKILYFFGTGLSDGAENIILLPLDIVEIVLFSRCLMRLIKGAARRFSS